MDSILSTVAKILVIPLVSVLTLAGYDVSPQTQLQNKITYLSNKVENIDKQTKLGAYNPTGGSTYRLQSSIGTTDTTIKLSSFKEPISNIPYTMSYLNSSVGYGTLDPQQPTRSEFISFTGITQNADGTATLTGVSRGMSRSYPYTASTTLRQSHSGQSIFILSDSPQHFAEYAVKANDETITGTWTFNNFPITASTTYASETVAGASELATGVEIASSTSSGGTTRRLTIPASLATSTYNSATADLKVVVTGNSGKIDNNFLNLSSYSGQLSAATTSFSGNLTLTGSATSTIASSTIQTYAATTTAHSAIFTWTKPNNLKYIVVEGVGGGGGGGDNVGGAGGGYCKKVIPSSALSSTVTITVGNAGAGGASTGSAGGNTSFGTFFTASGAAASGGSNGTCTNGDVSVNGSLGAGGGQTDAATAKCVGGGGGGSFFGMGAESQFSGGGCDFGGNAATVWGTGGGQSQGTGSGGNGYYGYLIVTSYFY